MKSPGISSGTGGLIEDPPAESTVAPPTSRLAVPVGFITFLMQPCRPGQPAVARYPATAEGSRCRAVGAALQHHLSPKFGHDPVVPSAHRQSVAALSKDCRVRGKGFRGCRTKDPATPKAALRARTATLQPSGQRLQPFGWFRSPGRAAFQPSRRSGDRPRSTNPHRRAVCTTRRRKP